MNRRRRERNPDGPPRKKRNWYLLPLLVVGGFYVAYGASELFPASRFFGAVWTAAGSLCLLFLAWHTFRTDRPPRRVETDEEPETVPAEDEAAALAEEVQETLALDEEISHEVYVRAKAAADAEAEREARERLRQLRALRALKSITQEEYERERQKVWDSMR